MRDKRNDKVRFWISRKAKKSCVTSRASAYGVRKTSYAARPLTHNTATMLGNRLVIAMPRGLQVFCVCKSTSRNANSPLCGDFCCKRISAHENALSPLQNWRFVEVLVETPSSGYLTFSALPCGYNWPSLICIQIINAVEALYNIYLANLKC